MKVFKFGGASVNSAERIRNVVHILGYFPAEPIMVIVSAMGKTTNALEKVADAFYNEQKTEALELFSQVKEQHLAIARELFADPSVCEQALNSFFTEAEWLLHDKPVRSYDYSYDQVVCIGELLSSRILSDHLRSAGISNHWMDVRDIFRTDDEFRDANIDWKFTSEKVDRVVRPLLELPGIVLTQGFIGATDENESTTLGREGSDYSAAVFANLLNAEDLTIWKDVAAVMNADPRQFSSAEPIRELNYHEVIEMAYYGAQVIHPKTIKPLQNKGIPLYVKCFLDPSLPGTVIHDSQVSHLPPVIVLKEKQVMMEMSSSDFSFIGERQVGKLYRLFEQAHVRPNLTQNGAITFTAVLDDHPQKIEKLALDASAFLEVQVIRGLSLLTIRHYQKELIDILTKGKSVLLRQQTPETIQMLLSD